MGLNFGIYQLSCHYYWNGFIGFKKKVKAALKMLLFKLIIGGVVLLVFFLISKLALK